MASTTRRRSSPASTELRAEHAKLLGFDSHAAFTLDDQMAKTPENALALMRGMVPAITARARDEAARLQARLQADIPGATLEPWDWQYYAEAVRRADYAVDQSEVRQYFELERVLRDGVLFAATRLYGITFRERPDIPVYHPDVRVVEVVNDDGAPVGLAFFDFFARPSKRGGAWMNALSIQSDLLGTLPVVTNVANFPKPSGSDPALLTLEQVRTLFHEFGHALHGLLSKVMYPSLSGTSVPRDFVELPSQFNEHWAFEPSVFANYARHFQTGEPMPASLRERIERARLFNGGFALTEQLAASFLDLERHMAPAGTVPPDVDAFEEAVAAEARPGRARGAAPLQHAVLPAHLDAGVLGGVLLVSLERGARRGCGRMVQRERRADTRQRPALPRHGALARKHEGGGSHLSRVPRARCLP